MERRAWFVLRRRGAPARLDGKALRFCLGAFRGAAWLRRNTAASRPSRIHWPQSALGRVLVLAVLTAAAAAFFLRPHGPGGQILPLAQCGPERILVHLLMILLAVLILPAVAPLSLDGYPTGSRRHTGQRRI